jgi:starvation-inducible DNA-binding protein
MAKATGASRSETRNQSSDVIHVPEPKLHQRAPSTSL